MKSYGRTVQAWNTEKATVQRPARLKIGGNTMKHQFDLQYFAEDNTDSVDERAVTEKESSEPKKTDNLKYSDKDLDEILSKKFAKSGKETKGS